MALTRIKGKLFLGSAPGARCQPPKEAEAVRASLIIYGEAVDGCTADVFTKQWPDQIADILRLEPRPYLME